LNHCWKKYERLGDAMESDWLPAIVASGVTSGAIGFVYYLIRRMIEDMSSDVSGKFEKVWQAFDALKESRFKDRLEPSEIQKKVDDNVNALNNKIEFIRDSYMTKETHDLVCGKTGLELERMFSKCLKKFEDNMFNEIRKSSEAILEKYERRIDSLEHRAYRFENNERNNKV
jgi:hypothetical protein